MESIIGNYKYFENIKNFQKNEIIIENLQYVWNSKEVEYKEFLEYLKMLDYFEH